MEETRMNINISKLARMTAITGTLVALGLVTPAQAEHTIDDYIVCASIPGLGKALDYLDFHDTPDKPSKIRVGLEAKLADAEIKKSAGKMCEASFKIEDFNTKINQLIDARKPKVSEPHPGTLLCLELGSDAVVEELDPDDDCGSKTKGPRNK
jgi:hypothetical protein